MCVNIINYYNFLFMFKLTSWMPFCIDHLPSWKTNDCQVAPILQDIPWVTVTCYFPISEVSVKQSDSIESDFPVQERAKS